MHTAKEVRKELEFLEDSTARTLKEMLLAYADLLEALEEADKRGLWVTGRDWLRLQAAEIARNRK